MLQTIRRNLNLTSLVAVIALVFAMTGGAYAASKYLITSTKQISPKVLKSLQGKAGRSGVSGAQGAVGLAGPAGAQGPAGPKGEAGAEGKEGKEGKAGKDGVNGKDGSPWTVGGTLPAQSSETGTWSIGTLPASAAPETGVLGAVASISFPIPLEEPLGPGHVHYIDTNGKELELGENSSFEFEIKAVEQPTPKPCPGTVAAPQAEPGELCVYESALIGVVHFANQMIGNPAESVPPFSEELEGAGRSGAILNGLVFEHSSTSTVGWGTWAVTAPES